MRAGLAPTAAHVRVADAAAVGVQRVAERVDFGGTQDDECRLSRCDPVANERKQLGDQIVGAAVEHGFVPVPRILDVDQAHVRRLASSIAGRRGILGCGPQGCGPQGCGPAQRPVGRSSPGSDRGNSVAVLAGTRNTPLPIPRVAAPQTPDSSRD